MKKINLLIVMAFATQGASLAGKTRKPVINQTFDEDEDGYSYSAGILKGRFPGILKGRSAGIQKESSKEIENIISKLKKLTI